MERKGMKNILYDVELIMIEHGRICGNCCFCRRCPSGSLICLVGAPKHIEHIEDEDDIDDCMYTAGELVKTTDECKYPQGGIHHAFTPISFTPKGF